MSFSLEQVVNILLDIGIDNVTDMNNIIYLYQLYGIQVYNTYFIEDVEFLITENTLQIKDMYKVDINKPVEVNVLFDEKIDILLKIVKWYKLSPCNDSIECKPILEEQSKLFILEEQSKLFKFTYKLMIILLLLSSTAIVALLVILFYQIIAY